jgi:hypothetical protein
MKKFRVNLKRLSMTLGVLGTSAGLLAAAAWYQAPLAASQPPGDPALLAEPTVEEIEALGVAAPPPGGTIAGLPAAVDPVQELSGDDDPKDQKAGKHGPTEMVAAKVDAGDAAPAAGWSRGQAGPGAEPEPAAAAPDAVADVPLEAGAAGAEAAADEARTPLVTLAAMDPAVAPAPRLRSRSAVGWRPVGRVWRGENAAAIVPHPALARAVAEVGEASWDAGRQLLAIPVSGPLGRRALTIHRLEDGRAYVDVPGAKTAFSGSRSADVGEGPLRRWVMAAHAGPDGRPVTRVAFRVAGGATPRLEVGGGEIRIALAGGVPAAAGGAAPAGADRVADAGPLRPAAPGTRLAEARYDVAAGVLSVPVDGRVDAGALRLKRLGADRLYLDVAGARPAFSGTRSAVYPGHALTQWKMAGHVAQGTPLTRLAFTLAKPGQVDVRVVDGEIRLTLPGHTGIRSLPATPAKAPAEAPREGAPAEAVPSEEEAIDADIAP